MYLVYSGYSNSNICDDLFNPCYTLKEFNSEEEVIAFKIEFDLSTTEECENVVFRVFFGEELKLRAREVKTSWVLE